MIARLAAAAAAALLLAACGNGGDGRYDARVEATRDAVRAGDREAALSSLEELGADALRDHADGDVSDEELFEITALVEQARAQVAAELPAPTTPTSAAPPTTAAITTAPAPVRDVTADRDDRDDDDEPEKKKDKDRRGDDGDDDDDD